MKFINKLIIIITLFLFIGCVTPQQKYNPRYIAIMTGDCVKRMTTIHNNMIKQGYEVRLIVGKILFPNGKVLGHAWIEYKDKKTGKWISIYNY